MRIPLRPPPFEQLQEVVLSEPDAFVRVFRAGVTATVRGRYRHWDKLRHLRPPDGLTHEQWWFAIKYARDRTAHELPSFRAIDGRPFTYSLPDQALEMLHRIDQSAAGSIAMREEVTNPATRDRYVVSSLIEEAITSSQLEGARTSHAVAQEMLRTGRPARDRSEQMIVNNYAAMSALRERLSEPLTPELVCDLHRVVTQGTLDDEGAAGRIQRPAEARIAVYGPDGTLLHTPPSAGGLPERLAALCEFANGGGAAGFLHPVLRAIIVHFWLGHDHPFVDGNGRTARALFYRSMLRERYWLAEFLSISRILRAAPAKYSRAFMYVETDDGDLTYFLLYQLAVLGRAIDELQAYLARKVEEVAATERLLRDTDLNHRQIDLLGHALRHPGATYTFVEHATTHRVVRQTARTDLSDLEARGLLRRGKRGRAFVFRPVEDLGRRLGQ